MGCTGSRPVSDAGLPMALSCASAHARHGDKRLVNNMADSICAQKRFKTLAANLNKRNKWGMAPLHLACEQGQWELVELLLYFGARVDLVTFRNHGSTNPLLIAASGGHAKCLEQLLKFGSQAHQPDIWGNTALFKAACYNFTDCVDLLLKHGADPNIANKWGAQPLQYASLQGHQKVIRLLIDAGADVTARGELTTPQAIAGAISRGHYACVKTLLDTEINKTLFTSTEGKPFLQSLVVTGYDDVLGAYEGLKWGHVQTLRLLFKYGASVENEFLEILCHKLDTYGKVEYAFLEAVFSSMAPNDEHKDCLKKLFRSFARAGTYAMPLLNMVMHAGYAPSLSDVFAIQQDDRATMTLTDMREVTHKVTNPRSLGDLCRLDIRRRLSIRIQEKCDKLPLPCLLKDFVKHQPSQNTYHCAV